MMALKVRYRPARDMLTFQDEVNRMIDSFFKPTPADAAGGSWIRLWIVRRRPTSSSAELPGVNKDGIKINLVNNTLTIRGEKKQETEEKKGNWHHLERVFGTFERALTLPASVQPDKIKARYVDGVLEITVPKAEEAKTRRSRSSFKRLGNRADRVCRAARRPARQD